MRDKTSFARDGFRQPNTVSNEVNGSFALSSAGRVHADDFAFHELQFFNMMTLANLLPFPGRPGIG